MKTKGADEVRTGHNNLPQAHSLKTRCILGAECGVSIKAKQQPPVILSVTKNACNEAVENKCIILLITLMNPFIIIYKHLSDISHSMAAVTMF